MSHPDRPATLGQLRDTGYTTRTVKEEIRANLLDRLRSGSRLPRHRRLRRHRPARARARPARRPRPGAARRARPGQDPADPHAGRAARRVEPRSSTARDQRDPHAPVCTRCRRLAAEHGDELPVAWRHRERALRREARDPRHQRRRPRSATSTRSRWPRAAPSATPRRCTTAWCRAPTAGSSRSTSCPTSPSGSRSRCSTCWRSATSRSAATRCGCRWTCCWWPAPTPRTTPTAAASSPR